MDINVAIAEDHAIFKQGIEAMFRFTPGFNLIIKASSGRDLLESIKTQEPHVVLLDLRMPGMDGLATLPILKREYPNIKVIILTLIDDSETRIKVTAMGACATLAKTANPEVIIKTIRECYNNRT